MPNRFRNRSTATRNLVNDDKETIITLIHMHTECLQRHKLGAVTLQLMGPKAEVAA